MEKQEELEQIKKDGLEMELQYLKSQINPHVLFNNLNTIYSYSIEQPSKVPDLIIMLSDNLKYVLYESNTLTVPLDKELEYIRNYISFQRIRTENLKKISYKVSGKPGQMKIAPLLLITIIENAFKHSPPKSAIHISIIINDGGLECICKNKVNPLIHPVKDSALGLENLKKRLKLLYRDKHELTMSVTEDYIIHLKLDLS